MSKIKALITTLVLGSSSVAMADSGLSFNASAQWSIGTRPAPIAVPAPTAPVIRDHRYDVSPVPTAYRASWVALSEPMMLNFGGRNAIRLSTPSRYSQLRLQSTAGSSYISTVTVRYADGTRQEIAINKNLDARAPMINFAVSNRASIDRIVVNGSSYRRASFQLFGTQSYTRPVEPVPMPLPPNGNPGPLPPVYQPAGMLLAHDINFANTEGRKIVTVSADKGRMSTLRVSGLTGSTYIKSAQVYFTDGSVQNLSSIEANLMRGQSIDLSVDGRGTKTVYRIDF